MLSKHQNVSLAYSDSQLHIREKRAGSKQNRLHIPPVTRPMDASLALLLQVTRPMDASLALLLRVTRPMDASLAVLIT